MGCEANRTSNIYLAILFQILASPVSFCWCNSSKTCPSEMPRCQPTATGMFHFNTRRTPKEVVMSAKWQPIGICWLWRLKSLKSSGCLRLTLHRGLTRSSQTKSLHKARSMIEATSASSGDDLKPLSHIYICISFIYVFSLTCIIIIKSTASI